MTLVTSKTGMRPGNRHVESVRSGPFSREPGKFRLFRFTSVRAVVGFDRTGRGGPVRGVTVKTERTN